VVERAVLHHHDDDRVDRRLLGRVVEHRAEVVGRQGIA
jgi:hypothetical protein